MNSNRLTPLDSLRGIAAIGVAFFWHYQHFQPQNGFPFSNKGYWFYHYGWNLVDFFFVLSGFIFSFVYKEKIVNGTVKFKEYAIFRMSRLYPLHFLTLMVVLVFQIVRVHLDKGFFIYQNNDLYHFILNALFIQGEGFEKGWSFNAPTWSVSSEIVAYILFFIIAKYILNRKNQMFFYIYVTCIIFGFIILLNKMDYLFINEKVGRVLIGFFIGCITYEVNIFIKNQKSKVSALLVSGAILLATIWYLVTIGHQTEYWQLVYTVLVYPLIIIFSLNISVLYKFLSIRPLSYLGDISYSIYLWHFPVQLIFKTLDDVYQLNTNYSSRVAFLIFVFITIALSIASFEGIEKPFSKMIRRKYVSTKIQSNKMKMTL